MNKDRKYNPLVHVFAGGAAGAVASAFTTPLDVVKTLLNTQETGVGLTKGMREAISQVKQNNDHSSMRWLDLAKLNLPIRFHFPNNRFTEWLVHWVFSKD